MDKCYFAKHPPAIDLRGGLIFIRPEGGHCEIAVTPATLQQFVASCNRTLDEWYESRGNVVPIAAGGR